MCDRRPKTPRLPLPGKTGGGCPLISRFSRAPIFVIHDIRMYGMVYVRRLLDLLKQQKVENELVMELFASADARLFAELRAAIPKYSLELTLESHDPELRRLNGKFPVSNEAIEETIEATLANSCRRLDLVLIAEQNRVAVT
jgi:hypothetical protein